jgi:inward rectifier potassium channel
LTYLAINALFALAYLLGGDSIANATPGSFADAFFFSVQTMASIGYGAMFPQTFYANCLVVMEAFIGLLFIAMATGMSFARFPCRRLAFCSAITPSLPPTMGYRR